MKIIINNIEYKLTECNSNYVNSVKKPPFFISFNGKYYTQEAIKLGDKKYFIM